MCFFVAAGSWLAGWLDERWEIDVSFVELEFMSLNRSGQTCGLSGRPVLLSQLRFGFAGPCKKGGFARVDVLIKAGGVGGGGGSGWLVGWLAGRQHRGLSFDTRIDS